MKYVLVSGGKENDPASAELVLTAMQVLLAALEKASLV